MSAVRAVPLGASDVTVERRPDGALLLRSPHPLGAYPRNLLERLVHWARERPDHVLAAQRDGRGGWRTLSYGDALRRARRVGQALLERRLSAERPLAILSENSLEHLALMLGALYAGVPCAPVSPAYSLLSSDYARLRHVMALATPGLVFAQDEARYAKAAAASLPQGAKVHFGTVPEAEPTDLIDAAYARTSGDTIAKLLFTSGSTGQPKAVIQTQRMWCANQQMLAQALPFLATVPPVLVDWLPWHHTAGGSHNIGLVIYNGGTLYIDEGRPVPGMIEKTAANLREVAPTIYFNVPRGYDALLPFLREDETLRRTFFSRMGLMQYAAAVLPQAIWKAYQQLALETCGEEILWITGYGATETAPFAMSTNRGAVRAGTVGLPVDGLEMKLAPVNGKLEARFRGPSITPGYWRDPGLTRAAFDEEGYYRTGDALRFLDPAEPAQGLEFDGRIAEDFKLTTGTWVSVGRLRAEIIAAGTPWVQDAVIAGHDRDEVCALVIPRPGVREPDLQRLLDTLAARSTGSSTRIARAALLAGPLSIDAGEITDKGSINQRAVLQCRADLVEMLYREPYGPQVLKAQT